MISNQKSSISNLQANPEAQCLSSLALWMAALGVPGPWALTTPLQMHDEAAHTRSAPQNWSWIHKNWFRLQLRLVVSIHQAMGDVQDRDGPYQTVKHPQPYSTGAARTPGLTSWEMRSLQVHSEMLLLCDQLVSHFKIYFIYLHSWTQFYERNMIKFYQCLSPSPLGTGNRQLDLLYLWMLLKIIYFLYQLVCPQWLWKLHRCSTFIVSFEYYVLCLIFLKELLSYALEEITLFPKFYTCPLKLLPGERR